MSSCDPRRWVCGINIPVFLHLSKYTTSMLLFPAWLAALAACTTVTTALKLSTIRKNVPNSSLTRRFSKNATSSPDDPFDFKIHQDILYTTTLQINGQLFQVNMDTGSSDLFLDTTGANLEGAINTGQLGSLTYGDLSQARGNLTLIDVTWGNYTVKNQIFINAPGTNATAAGTDGLLGLGPPSLSRISTIVDHFNMTVNGNAMLQNIFNLEPDKADFITFRLTRNVAGVSDGGDFTIGEVVPGYEQVLSTPKLPIYGDRWLTFMDALIVNGSASLLPL
ncbi:hypothetical protein QCA50_003777 [Cerrena zonata]|uniref:Peptidase A1 domain-containing protein n=1 Tax=Cerrena zonata TaxID=2478898 RepID=A0AAW0GF74_9APHY